jgi:hypothetical protein
LRTLIFNKLRYLFFLLIFLSASAAFAQVNVPSTYPGQTRNMMRDTARSQKKVSDDELLDSLRSKEEHRKDSVIFTSKFIKVTNERLLNDSTQVFPLDTGLVNFENYSPLYQPSSPRISLGNTGLPQRPLLFETSKSLGFDVGLHALDVYMLRPSDIQYYRARVAYTNLSLFSGSTHEQIFKMVHAQNIKPNWNIGLNFNVIGSRGFYPRQNVSDLNAGLFTWYESKSKRYNLLANLLFNNLKNPESGSILKDNIFDVGSFDKTSEPVRLNASSDNYRNNGLYIKQFYYIGRIDSLRKQTDSSKVLPTQRVAYTFYYNAQQYKFLQNDPDTYHVFPDYYFSSSISRDSVVLHHLQNDFSYSFYLRGKSTSFVKNELKVDLGLTHDLYHYEQHVQDSIINQYGTKLLHDVRKNQNTFENVTLKARLGYRFSDRIGLDANFQQVAVGYNFGDYLYDAKLNLSGGNAAGRIVMEAYVQSNKPALVYTNWISNHYIFINPDFSKEHTNSFAFNYINDKLRFDVKAEYFLINNFLYFASQTPGGNDAAPMQAGSPINLLKVSVGKQLTWRRWHFDNYVVYQKTDNKNILRTPEVYTYSSLYYAKQFFTVLNANIGINVRYNTPYVAPSYAVGLGQFYNGPNITFSSYPVATVFAKATLYRTNLFVMYDYANQGLFSNGFYTVNRYPMFDRALKFGVSWTFYD